MSNKLKTFLIFILFFSFTNVFASTNTFERTDTDLRVPSKVSDPETKKDSILTTPSVDAKEKVYDFADLYTDDEEQKLYEEVNTYINEYNMDFAIVTIKENNKANEVVYADDFYDYNDFSYDGLLFLIDMDNRQIYLSTSGKAINKYTDSIIDNILDSVYSYMSSEEYYIGTSKFIDLAVKYSSGVENIKPTFKEKLMSSLFPSLMFSLVITIVVMVILIRVNHLVARATKASEYLNKGSSTVENLGDVFKGSNTVRHKIETSSGGGSSTHSGSSGISHGGGGHGF